MPKSLANRKRLSLKLKTIILNFISVWDTYWQSMVTTLPTVPAQRYLMVIAGACAALYIMPHLARLRIEQLTSQDISTRASKHLQTQTMPRC